MMWDDVDAPGVYLFHMETPVRTLTIRQPWASLILHGVKRFETRSWDTPYRGPFEVHAGTRRDPLVAHPELPSWVAGELPSGCVLGTVDLVEVHRCAGMRDAVSDVERLVGDWDTENGYAWELRNPVRFNVPVSAKGKLGWWQRR